MISRAARRSIRNRPLLLAGGLLLGLLAADPVLPAEPDDDAARETSPAPRDAATAGAARTEAKKQALSYGLVMLAGIIVGGTILLTLVVLWGNRTRRLARSPLPPVAKRDELWFLKPKKDSGEEPGGTAETGPGPEPDKE